MLRATLHLASADQTSLHPLQLRDRAEVEWPGELLAHVPLVGLRDGVLFDALVAELLAPAGLLEAAERHVGRAESIAAENFSGCRADRGSADALIDPDGAGLDLRCDAEDLVLPAGVQPCSEAVLRVVCHANTVLGSLELEDDGDRAELERHRLSAGVE